MEHSLFCLLKNPSEQAEQRAYESWNRHSRAQSPCTQKGSKHRRSVFLLVRQKQGQRFLTRNSWRNFLGWRKEHNTTPSFREEAPRRKSKSNYWQPKKPKGTDMGMILGDKFCRVFGQNKVCFLSQNFVLLGTNWTKFAIFWEKFRQSFGYHKIGKKKLALGIWANYFDFISMRPLMYTQTPRYQLYPWYLIPSPFFLLGNKHQHITPTQEYSTHH